jgi:hypothetical protein
MGRGLTVIARRFAGLIEFEPHHCEVVHVAEAERGRRLDLDE